MSGTNGIYETFATKLLLISESRRECPQREDIAGIRTKEAYSGKSRPECYNAFAAAV